MKIARLVIKKLNETITIEEEQSFNEWLQKSEKNRDLYHRLQELEKRGGDISAMAHLDSEEAWGMVIRMYESRMDQKRQFHFIRPMLKYAAVFVGICAIGYGYFQYKPSNNLTPNIEANAITLQLDNGEIHVLSSDGEQVITDKNGIVVSTKQDSKLDYKTARSTDKLVYNTLSIPNGERFEIILSDGTNVHLNAGSSIRYPVKFLEGKKRHVFLVGEAYFDVSSDKEHPFIVNTSEMDVTVTGTKFNVTAYPEDSYINTVLVEGAVSLSDTNQGDENEHIQLEPGYKAKWDINSGRAKMVKVDTDVYTGWISGRLVLKNMPFKNIIKKLERHYDVEIKNNYIELNNQVFTASFDIETIGEVLGSFAENRAFTFEINDETISINKP